MFSSGNTESGSLYDVLKANMAEQTGFSKGSVAELMSLESASIHSLFGVINKILDDSIEKKNGEVSNAVARQLKKVLQLLEQRISREPDDLQKNVQKSRDEKHQPRKTLSRRNTEENEVVTNKGQQKKSERTKSEQNKKFEDKDVIKLIKEKDERDAQILALKQELDMVKGTCEKRCLQMEIQAKETKDQFEKKVAELENLLDDSEKKVKELEQYLEVKSLGLKKKEHGYKSFLDSQFGSLQELRMCTESIKEEILMAKKIYFEEFTQFGLKIKGLVDTTQNHRAVLAENRKLYNEVQDMKGKIRVYCRIRPFLQGQREEQSIIEHVGDNGELIISNPSKQAKDSHRVFKFNKVFGPAATQEDVYIDTRPLIRSILDGYNVCIFAYGQTGSGKTYTMSGPNESSNKDRGVNYRALNDLFHLAEKRRSSITYEVSVQMVEIYNEQVRDLLCTGGSPKKLGVSNISQPNGLAVPDASVHLVKSTMHVLELMNIGLTNRAVSATSLNHRSSRSHSIVTIHVHGVDKENAVVLHGSLHLVDLAGSERVNRSEVTGDRLKEAQHINKSLSALGDVIAALSQKSSHIPYRNSKLTQVLQGSLGGQAKTLMFIQLNPDAECYSESLSTLKFAERVSGIELGAARSSKEGRGVRELMDQVAILKNTVAKKDEEIGQLRLSKSNKNGNFERRLSGQMGAYTCPTLRRRSLGGPLPTRSLSSGKMSGRTEKTNPGSDNVLSEQLESVSPQSDGGKNNNKEMGFRQHIVDAYRDFGEDIELLGFGDADNDERLSDISDSVLSIGPETEGSINSIVELTLFPETPSSSPPPLPPLQSAPPPPPELVELKEPADPKVAEELKEGEVHKELVDSKEKVECREKPNVPTKLPRSPQKPGLTVSSRVSSSKSFPKSSGGSKRVNIGSSSPMRPTKRWQN